jgi:hypothetical protein
MAEITRLGRGGKRPGAGRKPGSPNKHTGASIAADVKEALAFLARINGRVDELAQRIDSIGGRVSSVKSAVTDGAAVIDDRLDLVSRRLVRLELCPCHYYRFHGKRWSPSAALLGNSKNRPKSLTLWPGCST